jgi:hypothetical protein
VLTNARNVLIVLLLAAGVAALPGGGDAADVALAILSTIIFGGIIWFACRLYRDQRVAIYALGNLYRAILYVSLAVIVLASAALERLSGAGVLIWVGAVAAAAYGLYRVWLHHREYGY